MLPKSFLPCFAPVGSVSVVGTPSSSSRVWAGKLKRTQWTQVPRGASGSSQIRARLLVPGGGSDQPNGGDRSAPSPVYCFGMAAPGWNALLVSSMDMGDSPGCVSLDGRLHPKPRTRQGKANISRMDNLPIANQPTRQTWFSPPPLPPHTVTRLAPRPSFILGSN